MAPQSYHSNPFALIRPALQGIKLNLKTYILVMLIIFGAVIGVTILGGIIVGLASIAGNAALVITLIVLILAALTAAVSYLALPYYRLILASAKAEPITVAQAMTVDVKRSWRVFGATVLAGLAVAGGYILLIVPGLIFSAWFAYVPYVVMEEGLTGSRALGRSRELARGHVVETWGTQSISLMVQILNLVPFLGSLLNFIIGLVLAPVLPKRYFELTQLKTASGEAPKTSGWNWIAIVLAIIITGIVGFNSIRHSQQNAQSDPLTSPTYTTSY